MSAAEFFVNSKIFNLEEDDNIKPNMLNSFAVVKENKNPSVYATSRGYTLDASKYTLWLYLGNTVYTKFLLKTRKYTAYTTVCTTSLRKQILSKFISNPITITPNNLYRINEHEDVQDRYKSQQ